MKSRGYHATRLDPTARANPRFSPPHPRDRIESASAGFGDAKTVAMWYDPADPAVSCLSYGLHRSILFVPAFAAT